MSAIIETNDLQVPDQLLTVDFFNEVLQNDLKSDAFAIRKIVIENACASGDNYASDLYRVAVTYAAIGDDDVIREKSLIVKNVQKENEIQFLADLKIFSREALVYAEVIPEMEKLLGSADGSMIAPRCLMSTSDDSKLLVLDDLKALGYKMGDRVASFDRKHSELVMTKIAQFHALSMVMAEKNPSLMESFDTAVYSTKDSLMKDAIFKSNLDYISDLVKSWPGYEQIAEKVRASKHVLYQRCATCFAPREGQLRVLNHGDLWVNNILLKYQDGEPVDMAMVDFQVSYYASPGLDIQNFLYTSVQLDVLQKHRYDLLLAYYHSLIATLQKFEYKKMPSWDDLQAEVRVMEFMGFWFLESFFAMTVLQKKEASEMSLDGFNNAEAMKEKRKTMFNTDRVKETFRYALMRFNEIGILDLYKKL